MQNQNASALVWSVFIEQQIKNGSPKRRLNHFLSYSVSAEGLQLLNLSLSNL